MGGTNQMCLSQKSNHVSKNPSKHKSIRKEKNDKQKTMDHQNRIDDIYQLHDPYQSTMLSSRQSQPSTFLQSNNCEDNYSDTPQTFEKGRLLGGGQLFQSNQQENIKKQNNINDNQQDFFTVTHFDNNQILTNNDSMFDGISGIQRPSKQLLSATYDSNIEANWIELQIQSKIQYAERNPRKYYIYQYKLRIWDAIKFQEASQKGNVEDYLFEDDLNGNSFINNLRNKNKASIASVNSQMSSLTQIQYLEEIIDGVEEFTWKEYEEIEETLNQSFKKQKKQKQIKESVLEQKKLKRLIIPYKFKYIKSEITLEISVVKDEETQINSPSFLESEQNRFQKRSQQVIVRQRTYKYNIQQDKNLSYNQEEIQNNSQPLYQCKIQFADLLENKNLIFKPSLVYLSSSDENFVDISLREFKDNQKTLISFCIQIPLAPPPIQKSNQIQSQENQDDKSKNDLQNQLYQRSKESIFKNSRLMLHEIIDLDEIQNLYFINQKEEQKQNRRFPNQYKQEVVKITRCKMRQKDTLEIEIGLKNISLKNKQFEERMFVLKFLDKLDSNLACKGRILMTGEDLLNIQKKQFGQIQTNLFQQNSFSDQSESIQKQNIQKNQNIQRQINEQSQSSCFVSDRKVKKIRQNSSKVQINGLQLNNIELEKSRQSKKNALIKSISNKQVKIEAKLLNSNSDDVLQQCNLTGPISFDKNIVSIVELIPNLIHVAPIICIDFSMANLTFSGMSTSIHSTNVTKPNQYRDLLYMMSQNIYSSELYLPIFGYGAKTFPGSPETSNLFPVSMSMGNPLVPNQKDQLNESYKNCVSKIKLDLPVKLTPMIQFLKSIAINTREKQEKQFQSGESVLKFPQVFYQIQILTSGIIDDIDDLIKVFEQSQWACLPIQINFINIYQKNLQEDDLDTIKLQKQINKYNQEIAGWKQLQIYFLKKQKPNLQNLSLNISIQISKTIEDYMFVNQLLTKNDLKQLMENELMYSRLTSQKDLIQQSHQNILDVMELNNNKLFDLSRKRVGINKAVFEQIVQQGDLVEWSVANCLYAAQNHDKKIVLEAMSAEEETQCLEKSYILRGKNPIGDDQLLFNQDLDFDNQKQVKNARSSMMEQSIPLEDDLFIKPAFKQNDIEDFDQNFQNIDEEIKSEYNEEYDDEDELADEEIKNEIIFGQNKDQIQAQDQEVNINSMSQTENTTLSHHENNQNTDKIQNVTPLAFNNDEDNE